MRYKRILMKAKMRILYGDSNYQADVTKCVFMNCYKNNLIQIPQGDANRARIFGDPLVGTLKSIFVVDDHSQLVYDHTQEVIIEVVDWKPEINFRFKITDHSLTPKQKVQLIHSGCYFVGDFNDEYPEQLLNAEYIRPDAKVLELGSNIGRSTIVIAAILEDETNLVTLECDPNTVPLLEQNRNINGYNFHIEPSALSMKRLFQKGWQTYLEGTQPHDSSEIATIDWEQLKQKYQINFDTLVLDCEGAFHQILIDMPQILDEIQCIIMENDYYDIRQKQFVDLKLLEAGFTLTRNVPGGWPPCHACFFQVWHKQAKV